MSGPGPQRPAPTGEQGSTGPVPAGIISRGLAAVVDLLAVLTVSGFAYLGLVLVGLILNPRHFSWPAVDPFFTVTGFLVIAIVYLSLWWGISGRTVGSALLGVRVVKTRGVLRWPVAILRAIFCTIFPIGLLWVVVDPRRRRSLQDIVLRTSVVYDGPVGPSRLVP